MAGVLPRPTYPSPVEPDAAQAEVVTGELAGTGSTTALRLASLPTALLLLRGTFSLFEFGVVLCSPSLTVLATARGGAPQDGRCHTTPVKLLTLKPFFSHLRQGLPVRSRARRPALMAPWLAFGPSLWPARGAGVVHGRLGSSPTVPSLRKGLAFAGGVDGKKQSG